MAEMEEAGANHVNGSAVTKSTTNPYETNPDHIPRDDPFILQSAQYGRYAPRADDFTPRFMNWYQSDPAVNSFWEKVAQQYCTPEYSLNISRPGEAFAVGSIIIRVDPELADGAVAEIYSSVNANELSAAQKAEDSLREIGVAVPVIYFCGAIEGRNVTIESRIAGVSLEVAWRYLEMEQIEALKNQCRQILQRLATIDSPPDEPSYVCRELNSQLPPSVETRERDILFTEKTKEEELYLTHNNFIPSNIIVQDNRVVGIAGWRQCGYFGTVRAKKVHRLFRDLGPASQDNAANSEKSVSWTDLYDGVYDPSKGVPLVANQDTPLPSVKTEPTSSTLDKFPASDDLDPTLLGLDGTTDYATSKTLANLKHGLTSRASSSDRSSPANSVKPANKKPATSAAKKGTAKKPAAKKRKVNDPDVDSADGRRSNTPAPRASKTPAKKQNSVSIAGSPAPEEKKKSSKKKKGPKQSTAQENDDSDSFDENAIFCICRRPDNHTWMIACDGDCDDWYHGKCVNIDPRDADLIERYICPNCANAGKGCTTWKPMCRLVECRKPARAKAKPPSKYCCDDHGREFMRKQTQQLKQRARQTNGLFDDLGSMGGILTAGDLKAAIMGVSSTQEFRKLGDRIISPPPQIDEKESAGPGVKDESKPQSGRWLGVDVHANGMEYSQDEIAKIEKLRKQRDELLHRKEMLAARTTFVSLLKPRAKGVVEKLKQHEPKGGWKDICGFDSRLSWSDEEFDEWRLSDAGKKALAEGTAEALAVGSAGTDADGDTAMNGDTDDDIASWTRGVCTKKRCERHKQWVKVQQQDILFEEETAEQDLARCEEEARSVVERGVMRRWAEKDNQA
ncbi:Zinc finger, PHD-type [Penicillium griseofulvum]|uniref:Zinc finger, PHD-type n=1 Tax=Penicillium patulum TaxID=5078 RepID=A0A135LIF6_PENPA|nr:Zinc finger, PHD-type [Penicillium griseofulvum]KXG48771.1 Zinc finger, PHD-type [Penicillium griseofulvum]